MTAAKWPYRPGRMLLAFSSVPVICLVLASSNQQSWAAGPLASHKLQTQTPTTLVEYVPHNAVCTERKPYYKPRGYQRYWRHKFKPFKDYYPYDPPSRCAGWPWSTDVCVGRYEQEHPLPVGIDCVR